jgi:FdhE protein
MPAKNSHAQWRQRIQRAERLSSQYEFAREILEFYGHVASFQEALYANLAASAIQQSANGASGGVRDALELKALLPHFRDFLSLIEKKAPAPLSEAARRMAALSEDSWSASMEEYWRNGGVDDPPAGTFGQFLARAFLQPYAELRAAGISRIPSESTVSLCPLCGARPLLGVLRPEGDGGKRFLLCSFCSQEWEFRRILCPACGEEAEQKLPVFVAEKFPHIRVETCDTCRYCIRTVDLTKDGNAIPIVDDLAVIPLGLWAEEYGYQRIHANLLGT